MGSVSTKKYNTRCYNSSNELIIDWNLVAKNKTEAETKGYLNCAAINGGDYTIRLEVEER